MAREAQRHEQGAQDRYHRGQRNSNLINIKINILQYRTQNNTKYDKWRLKIRSNTIRKIFKKKLNVVVLSAYGKCVQTMLFIESVIHKAN